MDKNSKLQSIEDRLFQLIPVNMSDDAQHRLEETIDELAGVELTEAGSETFDYRKWGSVAAAVALLLVPITISLKHETTLDPVPAVEDSLVLINSTSVIDGRADDGLVFSNDGSAPQYRYRYAMSNEEQLRDASSGIVITVRQPSYEVVTIPKQLF